MCWGMQGLDSLHATIRPPMMEIKPDANHVNNDQNEEDVEDEDNYDDEDDYDDEDGESSKTPKEMKNILFKQISAAEAVNCGIKYEDSSLYCWGHLPHLPQPRAKHFSKPGPYRQVSVGEGGICAILEESNRVECFGTVAMFFPQGNQEWDQIFVGFKGACGVTVDSKPKCYGISPEVDDIPKDLEIA